MTPPIIVYVRFLIAHVELYLNIFELLRSCVGHDTHRRRLDRVNCYGGVEYRPHWRSAVLHPIVPGGIATMHRCKNIFINTISFC